jgi:hypothetical protein
MPGGITTAAVASIPTASSSAALHARALYNGATIAFNSKQTLEEAPANISLKERRIIFERQ